MLSCPCMWVNAKWHERVVGGALAAWGSTGMPEAGVLTFESRAPRRENNFQDLILRTRFLKFGIGERPFRIALEISYYFAIIAGRWVRCVSCVNLVIKRREVSSDASDFSASNTECERRDYNSSISACGTRKIFKFSTQSRMYCCSSE